MGKWIRNENWDAVSHEGSAHKKASVLQQILSEIYHEYFKPAGSITPHEEQNATLINGLKA